MLNRLAILSVHTSPLAPMGGKKTGGMNVYLRELAYELGSRGIHVDIFTRRTSPHEPKIDEGIGQGVRVIYLDAGDPTPLAPDMIFDLLPEFTAKLIAFATCHSLKYDLIYSNYWLSGWVAQKLKESWGIPFVQMFHTLGQMKQRILTHERVLPNQRIRIETEIVAWADRIIAATPAEHAQLMWLYRANRRKIMIVPPGVNIQRFYPQSQALARQQLGIDADHKVLLFVGRIEPLKAIDTIINALDVLYQQDAQALDNLRFIVIGGDPHSDQDTEMQRLQAMTHDKGLDKIVQFVGAKDQSLLPTYYAAATIVTMPSDYESFGMVALEAMASGTPVIASKVGGLAHLVRDEETGFLVPVREPQSIANCIDNLLQDKINIAEMGKQAYQLAQSYSWQRIADRILSIFNDALDKNKRQPM